MTTQTLTLTDFLLARIAEDENYATAVNDEMIRQAVYRHPDCSTTDLIYLIRSRPSRVLAECEAKRRIVEEMGGSRCGGDDMPDGWREEFTAAYGSPPAEHYPTDYATGCDGCAAAQAADSDHRQVLALLALPYADHPDYRDEWRP